jgi:Ca2+-binding RTX toxin-like protein
MHGPMYMIANLAMGGGWAGSVDSTTPFPAQMKIDYIRAWDSNPYTNGGAIPPASPPPPPPASAPTSPPPPASGGGVTLTGSGYHDVLTGGAGNDTLVASLQGSGTLTGGSGADVFQFGKMPWTPSHITDFQPGVDKLDLHALYPTYTGSDPIRDGYVSLADDGHGGTNVLVDPDGRATGQLWPTYVVDLDHVSPAGLTSASLFGGSGSTTPTAPTSPPPPTAPVSPPPPTSDGVTLTGSGYGYNLTGGAGNDTLIGSTPGSGTMTGGAGADIFRFGKMPWTPSHITDFQVGVDKLDLHGLYPTYTGADPVRDGYVSLADDGHGGTNVLVDPDGRATGQLWPTYVVDLDHVSKASLAAATNWVM